MFAFIDTPAKTEFHRRIRIAARQKLRVPLLCRELAAAKAWARNLIPNWMPTKLGRLPIWLRTKLSLGLISSRRKIAPSNKAAAGNVACGAGIECTNENQNRNLPVIVFTGNKHPGHGEENSATSVSVAANGQSKRGPGAGGDL
jgi:hypothetical protein